MTRISILIAFASGLFGAGVLQADIPYTFIGGRVTVNGLPKEGAGVEVVPCDGAQLPVDWPNPAPSTVSTAPDPVSGANYLIVFVGLFGNPSTPGPAGSFTYQNPVNGAWYSAVNVQLKVTVPGCGSVTVGCDQVRQAYDASVSSGANDGKAVINVNVTCANSAPGDTATIGFWQNKNGQALVKALNGGGASTSLGNWLSSSFPYLFGPGAGAGDLTGDENSTVASLYLRYFSVTGPKVMAQAFATALAVYVTDSDLAGTLGTTYGFNVSTGGLAEKTYNVGSYGSAIGLADYADYTVLALLQQADAQMQAGNFNAKAFNDIFSAINEAGDRL